jgi:hypothetical protein
MRFAGIAVGVTTVIVTPGAAREVAGTIVVATIVSVTIVTVPIVAVTIAPG